ncbi:MAG: hypothetical protein M0P91_08815 [Sulfuricurvum sp.]|jgi:hypothetical protein|uniref:hypothetical protein n=1 Tax=Sulfuricurvum sp. TaxID=2025608 RepID=UPI0025DA29DA|nr:hypothetical protein [Sulfuricurvum sp.]MCK9373287.1 hypothetical protein [Sulfuricurvum sp.]
MKQTIIMKTRQILRNPKAQKALQSLKPEKTVWGFFGVLLFFIVPEIIAFIWGGEITAYAREALLSAVSAPQRYYYEMLIMLFNEGGSWFNLGFGVLLLLWLFF